MREIKYRQEDGCGGWHYWGYINGTFISPLTSDKRGKSYQFIGLLDKNGKEIYSGDIIDINQSVNGQNLFRVDFDERILCVKVFYLNGKEYEYDIRKLLDVDEHEKEIEVIGNVYETP